MFFFVHNPVQYVVFMSERQMRFRIWEAKKNATTCFSLELPIMHVFSEQDGAIVSGVSIITILLKDSRYFSQNPIDTLVVEILVSVCIEYYGVV